MTVGSPPDRWPCQLGKASGFGKDLSHEATLEDSVTRHLMLRHAEPPEHDGFRPA